MTEARSDRVEALAQQRSHRSIAAGTGAGP